MLMCFPIASQPAGVSTLGLCTCMGTSDYLSDRLSEVPRQSAARARRDWRAFYGIRTIGNSRSGRQVYLARHRAFGFSLGRRAIECGCFFAAVRGTCTLVQYMYVMSFTLESIHDVMTLLLQDVSGTLSTDSGWRELCAVLTMRMRPSRYAPEPLAKPPQRPLSNTSRQPLCYIALIRDYADPFLFRRAYHHAAADIV
jgi:hypothetical protein